MNLRNVVLGVTAVSILLIGHLLDQPGAESGAQRVAIGPEGNGRKQKKVKASVGTSKRQAEAEPSEGELRDPFAEPEPANEPRRRPRLEELELSELRLVAIVRDTEGKQGASVEDRSGIGFLLREGTRIGRAGAAVLRITPEEVVLGGGSGPEESLRLRPGSGASSELGTRALPAESGAARAQSRDLR